ncbi:MAG: putative GMC-type oxidoreductase [Myxococcota bacterium]|nr:putative GMC-type oxidoreductase [Myxococcota bacterium]
MNTTAYPKDHANHVPAAKVAQNTSDDADWVIIGSGAAGAAAARFLAGEKQQVIVLEEGPWRDRRDFSANMWRTMKNLYRDAGTQVLWGESAFPMLQGCCVGGSTLFNSAICWRTPEDVVDDWIRDHGVGSTISKQKLDANFDVIERELNIKPTDDSVLGHSWVMRRAAEAMGLDGYVIRRNERGCKGAAMCVQGCPNGAKLSMDLSYIPMALNSGARIYTGARVDRIAVHEGKAVYVEASLAPAEPGGRRRILKAHARKGVLIAASAIQTPQLLQKSGLQSPSRKVGEHFQCHPGIGVVGVNPDDNYDYYFGATQGYEVDYRSRRFKVETISLPPELLAIRFAGIGQKLMRGILDGKRLVIWGVQARATAHGSIHHRALLPPKLSFTPNARDLEIFWDGVVEGARMLFQQGCKSVITGIYGMPFEVHSMEELERAKPRLTPGHFNAIATHLFGTARMGADPSNSVVNPRFECHHVKNLYVVDSSVFPTNMGVNPMLSIMGMSKLCTDMLLGA